MAVLGFSDLRDRALPSLWDNSEILRFRMQDGRTFDQLVSEIRSGLVLLNNQLTAMPWYSSLWAAQDTPEVEYVVGSSNGFEEATEYSVAQPRRAATSGHAIGTRVYDRSVGWTMRYLQKARATQLDADVASVMQDGMNLWQRKLLERFFKSSGERFGSVATASVPFADGGTADANYVPMQSSRGEQFTSSHTHFLRQSAINVTNVDAAIEHLWEHGHDAPWTIVVSEADLATWVALANWRKPTFAEINYQQIATATARLSDVSTYDGYYESPRGVAFVWSTPRLPTGYYGVYKSYGGGDQRNPLRVRFDPQVGYGFNLLPGQYVNKPVELAVVGTEFGVGIGDRTNGVAVHIDASGSYDDPTIS